jgi:RHS repeat-associated protein
MRLLLIVTLGLSVLFLLLFGFLSRNMIGKAFIAIPASTQESVPDQGQLPLVAGGTTYVYGTKLIASKQTSGMTYHYQDFLGSNSLTTNQAGALQSRTAQYPYGKTLKIESTSFGRQKYLFTGKELDDSKYYFGARYYDPRIGSFVGVDPVQRPLSSYTYVNNNPLKYVDPNGEDWRLAIAGGEEFAPVWDLFFSNSNQLSEDNYELITEIRDQLYIPTFTPSNFDNPRFREGLVITPQEWLAESSTALRIFERETFYDFKEYRTHLMFLQCPGCSKDEYDEITFESQGRTPQGNDIAGGAVDSDHLIAEAGDIKHIFRNRLTGEGRDARQVLGEKAYNRLTRWSRQQGNEFNLFNYVDRGGTPQKNWRTHLSHEPAPLMLLLPGGNLGSTSRQDLRLQDSIDTIPQQDQNQFVQNQERIT